MQLVLRVLGFVPLTLLSCCYSFAEVRREVSVRTEKETVALSIWVSDQGIIHGGELLMVLWPVHAFLAASAAIQAPFNGDYDIQWGPLGALAGIVVPGLTVLPSPMWMPTVTLEVTEAQLDFLVANDGQLRLMAAREFLLPHLPAWQGTELRRVDVSRRNVMHALGPARGSGMYDPKTGGPKSGWKDRKTP